MVDINIEFVNGTLVRQGLEMLGAALPKVGRLGMFRTAQRVYARLGTYPRSFPGQVYKRTYTSREARSITKTENGYIVVWDPVNRRGKPYGAYLRGTPTDASLQSSYHRGRWVPIVTILNEELAKLPSEIRTEVVRVLKEAASVTQ